MKQKMKLYAWTVSDVFLLVASVALYCYMIYISAFSWLTAIPLLLLAGDKVVEVARDIKKIKEINRK